jgi:hypothetical protein
MFYIYVFSSWEDIVMDKKMTLLNCIDAFNKCNMDWLNIYYSKELEWNEMPRQMYPKGRKGGFLEYKQAAEDVLSMFPKRTLTVRQSFLDDNAVILEQEFNAVVSMNMGRLKQGDKIKQMILSIFILKNDLIIKQTDYISTIMQESN